jgi:hypothetical protein
MRIVFMGLGLAMLSACAASTPDPRVLHRSTSEENISVTFHDGQSRGTTVTRESLISRAEVAAPRQAVWNALPDAFREVGLQLPALDFAQGIAAVQGHRASARLGNERLSDFFDCGMSPTGLNAEQRRLNISVYVAVLPERDRVTPVELRADATAASNEGASSPTIPCSSSGMLERRLAIALQLYALQRQRD